ncbi:MAG: vWA domain-containing protein [Ginsengibacter sp.]
MKNNLYKFVSIAIFVLISCSKQKTADGTISSEYSDSFVKTSSTPVGGGNNSGPGNQAQPGVVTAGEWNDLGNWSFWKNLLKKDDYDTIPARWGFYTSGRISVNIKGTDNKPQTDIPVRLIENGQTLFSARTDNKGNAELYVNFLGNSGSTNFSNLRLSIDNGSKIIAGVKKYEEGVNNVVLPAAVVAKNNIDISFVIDATGSMGDELEYLKTELYDVINRAKKANPGYSLSTSSIVYRDEGDEYLTKVSPFTNNIASTIGFIKGQNASGGGDFPEAVHSALDKAVNELQWSANARARIIFLVLDAPPHDTRPVIEKMHNLIMSASEKGIKIIPVTASGIDKDTEFLMRFIAISTSGMYVFITNDSGIGNTHLEPTVGEYTVEFLNNLILRLINKYAE